MFEELDVYEDSERRNASLNMAIDEALLESATKPTLRFYGWMRPWLSFGYFGRYDDAVKEVGAAIWCGAGPEAALFCTAMI